MVSIFCVVAAYFIGGIPIGLWVGRAHGIPDIRQHGSGNTGATNVLRVIGVKAGLLVWLADCLKGAGPVLIAGQLLGVEGWWLGATGAAAVVGHCYSPYLRLTGGRGVSTGLGIALALFWPSGVAGVVVFVAAVALSKYVSLGSILGSLAVPLTALLMGAPASVTAATTVAIAVIIYRHAPNIKRLQNGTERKLGPKTAPEPASETGADDADTKTG